MTWPDRWPGGRRDGRGDDAAGVTDPTLVDVCDLSVSYGDLPVLDGVSLSVDRGEFVGLVGPNGAGKTTLLRAINGIVDPDGGSVLVDGDLVTSLSARAAGRRVATVPQDTTVAFDFRVEDVVEMGRTPYHGRVSSDPDAAAAVDRALERTDTEQFRDRAVGSLSGGERQRVVLARALAQETPALLLDEPTASLDVNHQVRTLGLVRELTRDGKGALAAIHDLDLAARFCDRIAVLADGDLLAIGSPGAVLTDDTLRTAFDTAAAVLPDPVTGTPTVTPLPERGDSDLRVHVAGSGRPAARAVARLVEAGATVTVGPLPEGDLAAATARELGVEPVTAPPFAPVPADSEQTTRESLRAADAAVLAGSVPPDVRSLFRAHDAVVRMTADGDSAVGSDRTGPATRSDDRAPGSLSPVATVAPGDVVGAARRAGRRRLEADD